jgi:hypothetical protein
MNSCIFIYLYIYFDFSFLKKCKEWQEWLELSGGCLLQEACAPSLPQNLFLAPFSGITYGLILPSLQCSRDLSLGVQWMTGMSITSDPFGNGSLSIFLLSCKQDLKICTGCGTP